MWGWDFRAGRDSGKERETQEKQADRQRGLGAVEWIELEVGNGT